MARQFKEDVNIFICIRPSERHTSWLQPSYIMYFYTINLCFKLFNFSGIHPSKGYTTSQIALFVFSLFTAFLLMFLVTFQFFDKEKTFTFNEVSEAASCVMLMIHCMAKSTPIFSTKKEIISLLDSMEYHFWDIEDLYSEQAKVMHISLHRQLKNKCKTFLGLYCGTLIAFTMGPLMSEGDTLIYECYRPPWVPYYALMFVNDMIGVTNTLFAMIPVDIFFMSLATLTQIQFKLLNGELETLFDEINNIEKVNYKICKCIRHHAFLLRFIKRINNTFSSMLLLFFGTILTTMCLEMYRASSQTDWKRSLESLMYTSSGLYEFIFCYCLPAQALMDEADRTSEKFYSSKWHRIGRRGRDLVFPIAMSQRDSSITAGGVIKIDLKTGLDTIKSMISYCMFLRTMADQKSF